MSNMIHESFRHGNNFTIGHFCVIEKDVVVGNNVVIGNSVVLRAGMIVGDNVFIDSHVNSSGQNEIKSGSKIRFGASIGRDLIIGENCFVSPHVVILYQDHKQRGLKTVIGENVFIGAASVINPGVTICDNVTIGSMSLVTRDIVEAGIYKGIPARKV